MASLKEVRTRIESVKSTEQITSAMKMVSASKLRKAQTTIQDLRPYAEKMETLIHRVFHQGEKPISTPLNESRTPTRILIVAIASNRGLCGPFNVNIGKAVMQRIAVEYENQYLLGNLDVITIGKKLYEYLNIRKVKVTKRHDELIDKLSPEIIHPFVGELMDWFLNKQYDKIELIYHHFKNPAVHQISINQFLPLENPASQLQLKPKDDFEYIYEPTLETVLEIIIPKWLNLKFYESLADSAASEHGARMIAMHKATDNAKELLRNLKLSYNKARQTAITNEIIEIIGGAESFNG
jgi:F-type H+-transporting ATPase subunit gamma